MKIKQIVYIFVLIGIIFGSYRIFNKYSYSKKEKYKTAMSTTKNRIIAIIGDSWASRFPAEKLALKMKKDSFEVNNLGHPGATTKEIYSDFFNKNDDTFSFQNIFDKNPQYCIVLAGVNDSARHTGKKFYAYHMTLIIDYLLNKNITPIILELPKVGLKENNDQKNIISKSANIIFEELDDNGNIYNTISYRNELNQYLKNQHLDKKIIFIDYEKVSEGYNESKKLYTDPLHLNDEGYDRLIEEIANVIHNDLKQHQQ
ncbi:SGNH/GDSL hydrolase family protein [Riemerella columbina]|uniref:SGNH/GDSL hydrolase family protein n=1 Tax=Riemerella columbina TaxID=103810 RepID=UPI0003747000|nr:SGNH/GDSL hydrolase family protein [Riemerella columbina]